MKHESTIGLVKRNNIDQKPFFGIKTGESRFLFLSIQTDEHIAFPLSWNIPLTRTDMAASW